MIPIKLEKNLLEYVIREKMHVENYLSFHPRLKNGF